MSAKHARLLVMNLVLISLMLAAAPASAAPASSSSGFKKTKIAVLDFQTQGEEFPTQDMGKIVAEWLITGLVETGRFDVIERRLLEKILQEQKLGMTGLIDPESAAQLGKVLGVKTIVSGTILKLGRTQEINARLINVDTGSIVTAEKVEASSSARLDDLVSQITDKIVQAFPLEGYVVQRTGDKVILDLGKRLGVKPGMTFIAYKEGKVIRHPKTGEILDVESIETGEIEITDVRDKTSTGVILREAPSKAVVYGTMVRNAVEGQVVNLQEEPGQDEKTISDQPKKDRPKRGFHIPLPSFLKHKSSSSNDQGE
jgi:TolB-like protein